MIYEYLNWLTENTHSVDIKIPIIHLHSAYVLQFIFHYFPCKSFGSEMNCENYSSGRGLHNALRGWGWMQGEETAISDFNNIKSINAVGDTRSNRRVKPAVWLTNKSSKQKNHNCEIFQDQN